MIIKNGTVLTDDFKFVKTDLKLENTCVSEFGSFCGDGFDADGMFVLPGFIDTHVHGANNVEFASADANFDDALMYEARHGITAIAPTTRCLPLDDIYAAFDNIVRESQKRKGGAKILGIHAEGPFVSPLKKGAMDEKYIQKPFKDAVLKMIAHGKGLFKILSIAPEIENADEAIAVAAANGIKISLAHTNATYDETMHAISIGASRATHLFNAMRPYNHRESGVLGACLTDSRINCELICDFVHNSQQTIEIVFKLKGADNITIVSDTSILAGLSDGIYTVDKRKRILSNGTVKLVDGTIAGSANNIYDGVKNLVSMGIPLEQISKTASLNPAKALGVDDITGSIKVGKAADLVCLDNQLNIKAVFIDGKSI